MSEEVPKQFSEWPVIEWVTKNLISQASWKGVLWKACKAVGTGCNLQSLESTYPHWARVVDHCLISVVHPYGKAYAPDVVT
ncbi:hypothetical protein evm_002542 [Chilo suppressalis]|nr:hypothetical protein evm_002542 [Chilo suppressalis]